MKNARIVVCSASLLTVAAVGSAAWMSLQPAIAAKDDDPRLEPQLVPVAVVRQAAASERAFTGFISARVQSNLGFRVVGKIVERLVNVGQQVKADQPLMRIDETDLRLALTAKRNAVAAARASVVQLDRKSTRLN